MVVAISCDDNSLNLGSYASEVTCAPRSEPGSEERHGNLDIAAVERTSRGKVESRSTSPISTRIAVGFPVSSNTKQDGTFNWSTNDVHQWLRATDTSIAFQAQGSGCRNAIRSPEAVGGSRHRFAHQTNGGLWPTIRASIIARSV